MLTALPWLLVVVSLLLLGPIPLLQRRLELNPDNLLKEAAIATVITSTAAAAISSVVPVGLLILPWDDYKASYRLDWEIAWKLGAMTLLYAIANVLLVRAIQNISPALFSNIYTGRIIPIVVISVVFLGEIFGLLQLIGLVIVIAGIMGALRVRSRPTLAKTPVKKGDRRTGIRDAILATLAFGIANTIDAAVIKDFDALLYLPVRMFLPAVLTALYCRLKPRDVREFITPERRRPLLLLPPFLATAAATFMVAYQLAEQLAVLATIHQLNLFATIGMSAVVDKSERHDLWRYVLTGSLCMGGIALVKLG